VDNSKINSWFLGGDIKVDEVSEEEIKVLIEKGLADRTIEYDEKNLIHNVFSLNDRTAKEIMTPRINITGIQANRNLGEQKEELYASTHSRLVVYNEDYDEILGYVLLRDALQELSKGNNTLTPSSLIKDLVRIKEDTRVDSMLLMFQKKQAAIAIVVDQFGGTAGLVTLEDVLEELVGEIVDETDEVIDMREMELKTSVAEG
jgi:CBS domain containing-hemolysin-like protein